MTPRQEVAERSGGVCEARLAHCTGIATHYHHRRRAGREDTALNLLHLCAMCHHDVHHNVAEAERLGYLVRSTAELEPVVTARIPWPDL